MTDTMTAMVQHVARGDHNVIINMVANVESVLEVKDIRACCKSVLPQENHPRLPALTQWLRLPFYDHVYERDRWS